MTRIDLPYTVKTVKFQTFRYISFWSMAVLTGIIILFQISQKLGFLIENDLGRGWIIFMILISIGLVICLFLFIAQTIWFFGLVNPRSFSNFFYGRILSNLNSHDFLQGADIRLKTSITGNGRILINTDLERSFDSLSSPKRLKKTNTSSEIDLSDVTFE